MRAARSYSKHYSTSSLLQIFRPAQSHIPDFLVPALAYQTHRPICPRKRGLHTAARNPATHHYERPSGPNWRNRLPEPELRHDIRSWAAAVDALLPSQLRRHVSAVPGHTPPAGPIDVAAVLFEAQKYSHDILASLCLGQQRWDAAKWIVKKLVGDGPSSRLDQSLFVDPSTNVIWPSTTSTSLQDLTNFPVVTHRVRPSRKLQHSLNELTSAPDSINWENVVLKRGLGQVWRSLGTLILATTKEGRAEDSVIMSHVLEILAYLHHAGLIPDSVYASQPPRDEHALQQPPTLHLLATSIMTALSDAQWKAREALAKEPKDKINASYFLGREIPGSRYQFRVPVVAPELWLELVLWSCLRGGWVLDGTAVLECMLSERAPNTWRVISWRSLFHAEEEEHSPSSTTWSLFGKNADETTKAEARARTQRTISSEVVTAFVDALVNLMRVGVGARGTAPEDLVSHIKKLKQLLERNAHSLGSATWESIMIRLVESGGIIPEKRPELLLDITTLASQFGAEVASANAVSQSKAGEEPPYFYEPSTASVGLLHRTMLSFLENGDIAGATNTLNALLRYTDNNKQQSLELFFEAVKSVKRRREEPFDSVHPPIDFPAFDPQLPAPLLRKLLDLATETKVFDLGRWLLLSEELDGPPIKPDMYDDRHMAASIVRFGAMAGENDLVLKVMKRMGFWSERQQAHRIPDKLFTTLLESQVRLHRWESVRSMQGHATRNPGYRPDSGLLATFAAELLRLSNETMGASESQRAKACDAFAGLLFAWEHLILKRLSNELYCTLGIMSSVDEQWRDFCSQFLPFDMRRPIVLSTDDFNQLLSGVLDGYGSLKGKSLVETWCHDAPSAFEPYRAPGGLPTMPKYRVGKAQEYECQPKDIIITQPSGTTLSIQGRVLPNRQTVWAILRKLQQEVEHRKASSTNLTMAQHGEIRETLQWAAKLLYSLGFEYEDVLRDLGGLAETVDLQVRPEVKLTGTEEESPEMKIRETEDGI